MKYFEKIKECFWNGVLIVFIFIYLFYIFKKLKKVAVGSRFMEVQRRPWICSAAASWKSVSTTSNSSYLFNFPFLVSSFWIFVSPIYGFSSQLFASFCGCIFILQLPCTKVISERILHLTPVLQIRLDWILINFVYGWTNYNPNCVLILIFVSLHDTEIVEWFVNAWLCLISCVFRLSLESVLFFLPAIRLVAGRV